MDKKSKFAIGKPSGAIPKDPESLFRDLKGRSATIPYLWSHQSIILNEWFSNHLKTSDVALELPTGTGKTLIGLLIGEFRRVIFQERVLYLCLTRQLANQVYSLSNEYGLHTSILIGAQNKY